MADINITITIPDEYIADVVDTFTGCAGHMIEMNCHDEELNGHTVINYIEQQDGEAAIDFGKRVIRKLIKGLIEVYQLDIAEDNYRAAIADIPAPSINVPDNIIE